MMDERKEFEELKTTYIQQKIHPTKKLFESF